MDFKEYYLNQASGLNYPVFRGALVQRGYGLGGAFRRFFNWVMPLLKQHAAPVVKSVGKEIVNSVANVANDVIEGKNASDSVKHNLKSSIGKLSSIQRGKGYKRKRKSVNIKVPAKKVKKFRDIFSENV